MSVQHFSRALLNDMGLQPEASQFVLYGPWPHLYTVHRGCFEHDTTSRQFAVSLSVSLPRSALQPAQNNGCGPLPQNVCRPMPYGMRKVDA